MSALLDGEEPEVAPAVVDDHVQGCGACRAWVDEVTALHRTVRVREAEPVPDLTAAILAQAPRPGAAVPAPAPGPSRRRANGPEPVSGARWGLFAVALTQLLIAAPALLLGEDAGATVHVARELGSFDVALAVGLLVAAWQPARAWGLLPVAAVLALVTAGSAALDVVNGRVTSLSEAHHVLDLAGVLLLWLVAREAAGPAPAGRRRTLAPS